MYTQIGDLREGDSGHVDDDGYVHEERDCEQQRTEGPNRSGESDFQILEGAVQLQFVEHRQKDVRSNHSGEDRRDYARGVLSAIMVDLGRYAQQSDPRNVTNGK